MNQSRFTRLLMGIPLVLVMCCSIFLTGFTPPAPAPIESADTAPAPSSGIAPAPRESADSNRIVTACDPFDIVTLSQLVNNGQWSEAAAKNFTDCYAWDLFIALNWPSDNKLPWRPNFDPRKKIGDPGPVVWEAWKETSEVYLANGAQPKPWGTKREVPAEVLEKAKQMGLPTNEPFHNLGLIQQVSGLVFKSSEDNKGEPIRYELAMNESTFNYILGKNPYQTALYNKNGQEAVAKSCNPPSDNCIQFPWNAMEIKTSWLWLPGNPQSQEIADRYITVNAYYPKLDKNGTQVTDENSKPIYEVARAAMTGMHITSKALKDWVWTTFENVYNAQYTPTTIENGILPEVQEVNKTFQKRLQGTKYANYELVGTQINFTDHELLANSQIETHFQKKSSCITCHKLVAVSNQKTGAFYLSFVDKRDGNLTYYVGEIPPDLKEQMQKNFVPMDYVWSLRLAKRQRSQT